MHLKPDVKFSYKDDDGNFVEVPLKDVVDSARKWKAIQAPLKSMLIAIAEHQQIGTAHHAKELLKVLADE